MSQVSLSTSVAGISMDTCVYNASGPRTGSSAALAKIAASASGGVLAKSATLESQTGNPLPRTWHATDGKASMNSEGLPNSGIDYYISQTTYKETMETSTSPDKPYMVSISGKTLADNLAMMDKIEAVCKSGEVPIACVELNLACPNVIGKPIIAYDNEQMRSILQTIQKKNYTRIKLGLKLPPFLDSQQLSTAATTISQFASMVKYVACINTIGNALAVDPASEAPFISSNNGLAGLSGPAVKYTAMANVRQMRDKLDPSIDVVGVGGIETGTDAFLFLLCGAAAVQVGTCHWNEGPKCFDRICDELRQVMSEKGYSSVKDVQGKIKTWSKEGAALTRAARKKAQADAASENSTTSTKGANDDLLKMINAGLVIIIAILLADKFIL